ncbi:hypothetical protein NPIL_455911 [Nephila pilipes]|uniref:Uncharacterized protein n=1 Tax=Nephila pilipes TaxID=299642 RepID=A0A8X6TKB6_NEPPI|nr:hypothetical protein NPIL_455911 [Nephila pilipes]
MKAKKAGAHANLRVQELKDTMGAVGGERGRSGLTSLRSRQKMWEATADEGLEVPVRAKLSRGEPASQWYNLTISYLKGPQHGNADALTRLVVDCDD